MTPDPIVTDPVEPEPDPNRVRKTKARSLDNGSLDHLVKESGFYTIVGSLTFDTPDKVAAGSYTSDSPGFADLYIDGERIYPNDWFVAGSTGVEGFLLQGVHLQYLDDEGQPVAISGYLLDDELDKFMGEKDATISYTYEGVGYKYVVSKTDDLGQKIVSDADGQITYSADTGTWSGTMGDVLLKGTLDGKEVKGTAMLDDMKGGFSGIDGHHAYTTQEIVGLYPTYHHDIVTAGGFSGDNGEDSAFSGSWRYSEEVE